MKLLTNYIIALSNLYGLISPEKVLEIYNAQNDAEITKEALTDYLDDATAELERNHVYVWDGLFVHEAIFVEDETPREIFEERKTWPYYVPEKEELLRYVDHYYFEKNAVYERLTAYLTEHIYDGNRESAEEISTEVHDYLSADASDISGAFNRMDQMGASVEDEEIVGALIELVGDYARNVRLWKYNGFSLQGLNEHLKQKAGIDETNRIEGLSHLEKYIVALTNLYGRVTKEKVAEVYNRENQDQVTLGEMAEIMENPPELLAENLVFVEWDEFVTEDLVMFEEVYYELKNEQAGKPFYMPEEDELFKYLKLNYVDYPKAFNDLVEYLETNIYPGNSFKAESTAENMQLALEMGDGVGVALSEITDDDFMFENEEAVNRTVEIVTRLNNETRMRKNNGFTPNELRAIKTIGRNDPCYCGSGKKYKKCCMKKDRMR
jgi:uncharacterized protein YchJ